MCTTTFWNSTEKNKLKLKKLYSNMRKEKNHFCKQCSLIISILTFHLQRWSKDHTYLMFLLSSYEVETGWGIFPIYKFGLSMKCEFIEYRNVQSYILILL